MGSDALRGSLSKKFQSQRYKLNQGTPEKSEIYLMFEKIKLKREQNMAIQPSNNGQVNSKTFDSLKPIIIDDIELTSSVPKNTKKNEDLPMKNSPILMKNSLILKPQKLNKLNFDELRSIFDVGEASDEIKKSTGLTEKSQVKRNILRLSPKKF